MRTSAYLRIEGARPAGDPQRGFAAELGDPAWMVGRQWQFGEHQGEDASSPIAVTLHCDHAPIEPMEERPGLDPRSVPAEAIVEMGPLDWWTVGRRLRLGFAADAAGLTSPDTLFANLTGPYAAANGRAHDGLRAWQLHRGHAVFAEVPEPGPDCWGREAMVYTAEFPCGGTVLQVGGAASEDNQRWPGHDGGDLDWWSADAAGPVAGGAPVWVERTPTRFRWPGAPADRWWQIEDRAVDIGGLPPDRAHVTSLFLLDLLLTTGDDWFLFSLDASAGSVVSLEEARVTDAFGDHWEVPLVAEPDDQWRSFAATGLAPRQLIVWSTATDRLSGDAVEVVTVGLDEDTNLAWAVEEVLDGAATRRRLPAPGRGPVHDDDAQPGAVPDYTYAVATDVPDHWHPYVLTDEGFLQGRLAGVRADGAFDPDGRPPPEAAFLQGDGRLHRIAPWRLPPHGLRLESRTMLARATDGSPVLWVQRRRQPLLALPPSGLRFDAVVPNDNTTR